VDEGFENLGRRRAIVGARRYERRPAFRAVSLERAPKDRAVGMTHRSGDVGPKVLPDNPSDVVLPENVGGNLHHPMSS
jgi:hypothetical protein